jgi:putative hydrolase of the HAD superfamily
VITTLLLDVDGVLVSSSPDFRVEMDRDYAWRDGVVAFLRELGSDPAETASLTGDGDIAMVAEKLLPAHVVGLTAAEFVDRWFAGDIVINRELIDLVLQTGIKRIFLATNQERLRGTYISQLFAAEPWLTGSLISYDLGFAKPDPAYFTAALSRIDVPADECLFVDDRADNVEAARGVGMHALRYRDLIEFGADLQALGLLPADPPAAPTAPPASRTAESG